MMNESLPSIYSVEVTNACNFTCDFCPRGEVQLRRPDTFLDVALAKTIATRDLGGSYWIEFQLSGEPMLHPHLDEILAIFAGKVKTGMSINCSVVRPSNVHIPLSVDYLTISIDSITKYEEVRKGGRWRWVVAGLSAMVDVLSLLPVEDRTVIDLQLIEFPGYKKEAENLALFLQENNWQQFFGIRTVPDSFLSGRRGPAPSTTEGLCIDPWVSVVVQADGDVVPCCFAFGKEIVYGNLNKNSLEEVWNGSVVAWMREKQRTGVLPDLCGRCYMKSSSRFHWGLYTQFMKGK